MGSIFNYIIANNFNIRYKRAFHGSQIKRNNSFSSRKTSRNTLIWQNKGQNSPNLKKLSGIPYLSGDDTWIDFPRLFSLPLLQPDKVHFRENYHPDWVHVLPLLREMESVFTVLANNISVILKEAETKSIIQKLKRKSSDCDREPRGLRALHCNSY